LQQEPILTLELDAKPREILICVDSFLASARRIGNRENCGFHIILLAFNGVLDHSIHTDIDD
jgi:hypothetical protein